MLYAIISIDVANSLSKRLKSRPDHLKRLKNLKDEGRLILAGPNPAIDSPTLTEAEFTGSLVVAEFNNLTEAQNWANTDPYLTAGVYETVTVKPFIQVLP